MAITDKDITKLRQAFATKEELKDLKTDLRSEIGELRGEVLTGMDKIMLELERAREDRVFAIGKDREQDRRLDALEARVGR